MKMKKPWRLQENNVKPKIEILFSISPAVHGWEARLVYFSPIDRASPVALALAYGR